MMLVELRLLLAARPETACLEDYRAAVIDENVLGKGTLATRRDSFRRLRELYALRPETLLFRALRDLWAGDAEASRYSPCSAPAPGTPSCATLPRPSWRPVKVRS